MPDMVRLRQPVAPGQTVTLESGEPAVVLRLSPTVPAEAYDAIVTTATPRCIPCDEYNTRYSGGRWLCPACSHTIRREDLREWAIRYMINLGRFGDPMGGSHEAWSKWWVEWEEGIRADADAADKLVNNL